MKYLKIAMSSDQQTTAFLPPVSKTVHNVLRSTSTAQVVLAEIDILEHAALLSTSEKRSKENDPAKPRLLLSLKVALSFYASCTYRLRDLPKRLFTGLIIAVGSAVLVLLSETCEASFRPLRGVGEIFRIFAE